MMTIASPATVLELSCILAIDPGLTGAVAFYFPSEPSRVAVFDMPTVGTEVDPHALARQVQALRPSMAAIELVGPMPTDSRSSAFKFGGAYMTARTVVTSQLAIPTHLVTPQTWKRHYRLVGGAEGKEAARALALRLFPASAEHFARKKDHGRAEAALLARFASETLDRRQA